MIFDAREKKLISWLKTQELSGSHQLDHLTRVARYGAVLAELYEGRAEVVVPAALLHDLGRNDTSLKGKASAEKGAMLAEEPLKKAGYGEAERKLIRQCIAEHDVPGFHSALVESRMLKEADFLDSFGARGVMRSLIYSGEDGSGVAGALNRLRVKMRQRLDSLEFVASKRMGWRLYRLVEAFVAELELTHDLSAFGYTGSLVVLEGISGCGKDTQAALLQQYLKKQGRKVMVVNHPTEFMKGLWRQWRGEVDDRLSEAFLMMADRARMSRMVILPALHKGVVVISTRSSLSAQVYQMVPEVPVAVYRYVFSQFEPVADKLIYLDVPVDVAWERTGKRVSEGKEADRGFFAQKQQVQKERLEAFFPLYPQVVRVDASGTPEIVAGLVREAVL